MTDVEENQHLLRTGRLTSKLIHDFKNQLGGMKLYAAYLKRRFADNPEGVEVTDKIIEVINNMAEQASVLSRLTRPLELKTCSADLVSLIEDLASECRSNAGTKNVSIITRFEEKEIRAELDSRLLSGALKAILERAIDSTAAGGEVVIQLSKAEKEVSIAIIDRGENPGELKVAGLFDPLSADRIDGRSLELALAERIIENHRGSVGASVNEDRGVTINVSLPLQS